MAATRKRRKKTTRTAVTPVGTSAFEEMEAAKAEEMAALEAAGGPKPGVAPKQSEEGLKRTRALYGIPEDFEPERNELGQPILEGVDFFKHANCVNTIKWFKSQLELRQTQLKLVQAETQRKIEVLTQNAEGLRQTIQRKESVELADICSMLEAKYGVDIATAAIDDKTRVLISEQELQRLKT